MNTLLKSLFEKYEISEKDQYEINQIFNILNDEKKHKILASFELLAEKIKKIEEELLLEQSILLDNILPDIKELLNTKI
ncbi:MAG: hypothetical protein Q9M94_07555 [Candidatus Gracilibacteria bacterium]|nr:hypothetical protein [Candidatus Gracilibacteria bacterium]